MFGKPSKKKFARQLIAAIQELDSTQSFHYDADAFRLVRSGKEGEINLSNIYIEHCNVAKEDRAAHVRGIASIFAGSPEELTSDFDEAKPHLRPKIWARATMDLLSLKAKVEGTEAPGMPLYPLGSHLYSSLVYDTDMAMRSLSNEDLENWGVTYYEAMEIACRNLDESTMAFAKIGDSFVSSASGDNYDSSRILLTDRINSFDLEGDLVAIVPQRDAMYIASLNDEQAVKIMFDLTQKEEVEEARPLSPLPLILQDGEWVDWEPPKNHIVRKQFEELELNFLGGLYTQQKELLDALFEGDIENAAFVASFSAMQKEDSEEVSSYCVWGEGVDSLLPRTQLVMFAGEAGMLASGEWSHVKSVVGDLLVRDESYYPVRYRAREFPSELQLQEIGVIV